MRCGLACVQGDQVKKGQLLGYVEQLGTFVAVEVRGAKGGGGGGGLRRAANAVAAPHLTARCLLPSRGLCRPEGALRLMRVDRDPAKSVAGHERARQSRCSGGALLNAQRLRRRAARAAPRSHAPTAAYAPA